MPSTKTPGRYLVVGTAVFDKSEYALISWRDCGQDRDRDEAETPGSTREGEYYVYLARLERGDRANILMALSDSFCQNALHALIRDREKNRRQAGIIPFRDDRS